MSLLDMDSKRDGRKLSKDETVGMLVIEGSRNN